MDLGLNEAQQMLKNSAQEFLEAECSKDYVREMEEDERGELRVTARRAPAGGCASSM